MIKIVITIKGTAVEYAENIKEATQLEARLLVQEFDRRKHELLHQIEDEYDIKWGDEE